MGKNVFKWKISMIMLFMLFIMIPGLDVKAAEPEPEKPGDTEFVSKNGWEKENDKWYYYTNGKKAEGWKKIGGKWYYFLKNYNSNFESEDPEYEDEDPEYGEMLVGLLQENNKFYYLSSSGAMVTGWKNVELEIPIHHVSEDYYWSGNNYLNGWYYFGPSGVAYTEKWLKYKNDWYYFDSVGRMCTGVTETNDKTYYFDNSGKMKKITGWINKKSEYHSVNGWYYFNEKGVATTGWKKINGYYYYFFSNGRMAHGEFADGYWLNNDGKWTYKARASWHENSKGKWYGDTTGWYAKGTCYWIDDEFCGFYQNGYYSPNLGHGK